MGWMMTTLIRKEQVFYIASLGSWRGCSCAVVMLVGGVTSRAGEPDHIRPVWRVNRATTAEMEIEECYHLYVVYE